MTAGRHLILDFDSTLVTVEALEALAEIVLAEDPDREAKVEQIRLLTDQAMEGVLDFGQSLRRRFEILEVRREHIGPLVETLKRRVSPSVWRNRAFFAAHAEAITVVSGGFHEYIDAVVEGLGIPATRVVANRLTWNADGRAGVDEGQPTAHAGGKVDAVRALKLKGPVAVVGDGWTDYEIKAAGLAERFYAYVESATRPRVMAVADAVAATFDEVLHAEGLAGRFSYPRSRMKVLLLESIHPEAVSRFREEGYDVETLAGALDEAALKVRLKGVHVLGIRSKSRITAAALEGADRLLAVGAFCIGVNQIDLEACSAKGVAVFNAPYSNTRSVVELAIGEIVALTRRLTEKSAAAHAGRWDKSAAGAHEIRGKTLGIVGYGAIGSQLSVLAEAMGMAVIYYDVAEKLTLGNARRVRTLDELMAQADVVSLHVDGRSENRRLIGREEIGRMKPGALILNLSRGHIVDIPALAEAIREGRIGGAGLDVFPDEPEAAGDAFDSELRGLPNVILTPHIGGSTEEAQAAIGEFAATRLLAFLDRGDTTFSVNLPNVQLGEVKGAHRLLHIHRNQPGVLAAINSELARHGMNISAQHLKTNEAVGYVITDVDAAYDREAVEALRGLDGTLKFRVLY